MALMCFKKCVVYVFVSYIQPTDPTSIQWLLSSPTQVAEIIRDDQIDILIELAGPWRPLCYSKIPLPPNPRPYRIRFPAVMVKPEACPAAPLQLHTGSYSLQLHSAFLIRTYSQQPLGRDRTELWLKEVMLQKGKPGYDQRDQIEPEQASAPSVQRCP